MVQKSYRSLKELIFDKMPPAFTPTMLAGVKPTVVPMTKSLQEAPEWPFSQQLYRLHSKKLQPYTETSTTSPSCSSYSTRLFFIFSHGNYLLFIVLNKALKKLIFRRYFLISTYVHSTLMTRTLTTEFSLLLSHCASCFTLQTDDQNPQIRVMGFFGLNFLIVFSFTDNQNPNEFDARVGSFLELGSSYGMIFGPLPTHIDVNFIASRLIWSKSISLQS